MRQLSVLVENPGGLHARPAAAFVAAASRFESSITIRNLTSGSPWADAKSIIGVLALGVERGHHVEVAAEGRDEVQAVRVLEAIVGTSPEGRTGS